jgi:hypothetical protein
LFWIHLCKALIHILLILISLYIARNNAPVIQFSNIFNRQIFVFKKSRYIIYNWFILKIHLSHKAHIKNRTQ